MTKPKYKESGREKFGRLRLRKPHIYWDSHYGEWLYAMAGASKKVRDFCVDQDTRWTPRRNP